MSDLPNLDAARAALKAFHESGRQIVVDRLSGRRKAAPMNRHLPNCERYLSDALAVVDALTARLAEAEAAGRRKGLEEAARLADRRYAAWFNAPGLAGMTRAALEALESTGTAIRALAAKVTP